MVNWMDVEMEKTPGIVIVDMGYINDESTRNRADKILALGVSSKNLILAPSAGSPRLHFHIPKTKVAKVMDALPIQAEKTWFGATHSYLGKNEKQA